MLLLLRLNYMLYTLYLSFHSNTEAVIFACLSLGWATTTGRLLGSKMENFPRTQRRATASGVERESTEPNKCCSSTNLNYMVKCSIPFTIVNWRVGIDVRY